MENKQKKILKKVEKLRGIKNQWNGFLEEIYKYSMPNRNTFSDYTQGHKRDNHIFDSTAVVATNGFVSRIQTLMVKPWAKWFLFEAGQDIPESERKDINKDLEKIANIVYEEINYSNFAEQISSSFFDLAASTGVIMVREDVRSHAQSSLVFEAIPLSDVMLESASDGDIKTVFRDIKIPAGQVQHKWKQAKLTSDLKDLAKNNPDEMVELVEGVVYNEDKGNYNFILLEKSADEKDFLIDISIDESPYIVFREYVTPGETYGRGRLMNVLGDIKSANKIMEYSLSAAAMSIAGVYTAVNDGIFNVNTARFAPGAVIPVSSNGQNPTIAPLSNPSDINVTQFELAELRRNINNILLTMPLGNIEDVKGRSATEMSLRQNDFLQQSAAGFNRLQTELLNKIVIKVVYTLKKLGKIDPIEINGKEVKVKFKSPVSTIQGNEELQKMQQFLELMRLMPESVSNMLISYEKIPQDILDHLDLPEKYVRSEIEFKKIAQQQAVLMQQQMGQPQPPQGM